MTNRLYRTKYGEYIIGDSLKLLANGLKKKLKVLLELIITIYNTCRGNLLFVLFLVFVLPFLVILIHVIY